jgi:transposase
MEHSRFVGIDVAKEHLDVHLHPGGEAFRLTHDEPGLQALGERLRASSPTLVVLEASGGYEVTVAATLAGAGLPVAVVNPRQIRDFGRATGQLAKTDRLDARTIALFAAAVRPAPRPLPSAQADALGELVARRRQLVDMLGAELNRRRLLRDRRLQHHVDAHVAWLEEALRRLDHDLTTLIRSTPVWRETEDLLRSVPGIGAITALTLIADLPELGGRAPIRRVLYMATLTAITRNPVIAAFYQRLLAAGRPSKVALTAAMRKLLTILNAMLRDRRRWQSA